MAAASPRVLLQTPIDGALGWLELDSPTEILVAATSSQVRDVLREAEAAALRGSIAAGFVSYGAAPAFDPALRVQPSTGLPAAWFGLFREPYLHSTLPAEAAAPVALSWQPSISPQSYRRGVETILNHIAQGDVYQVNYTLRIETPFGGDPLALFAQLSGGQQARCSAYVDTGRWAVCSASPELFFHLRGECISCRPMKGTAPRGRTAVEDRRRGQWLHSSEKNRAENLMIVDMVRNDLGRIAAPDSVQVKRLWQLEKYPSLFQLTSTVEARSTASIVEIFAALFPCASITGAPKIRAMELIAELEDRPRGIYTGAVGSIGPGRQARFNVAIRTALVDRRRGRAEYGTGGGIVWDSEADEEWEECRTKALVLAASFPRFDLLETLRWDRHGGLFLLRRHLDRLAASASYFDYPYDEAAIRRQLAQLTTQKPTEPQRLRLLLAPDGSVALEATPLGPPRRVWRVALADHPVDSADRFLYHKTTHRRVYDEHRRRFPAHDDVLLWNEHREVTESTLANVVLDRQGEWITPPVDCGLLAGTRRAELLARGRIREERILLDQLTDSDRIFLINSLRGWIPARLDRRTLSRTLQAPSH